MPQYQQMKLLFEEVPLGSTNVEARASVTIEDDAAGDAHAVLRALRAFVIAAGFTWVRNVAFEKQDGTMLFSDQDHA